MAVLGKAKDGHWFVRMGFPFDDSEHQVIATYQISPRGEQILAHGSYQNGDSLGRTMFYALYLDGGLLRSGGPEHPSVYDLPEDFGPSIIETTSTREQLLKRIAMIPGLSFMAVITDIEASLEEFRSFASGKRPLVELAAAIFLAAKAKEEADRIRDPL
jgi:hypothetical protein